MLPGDSLDKMSWGTGAQSQGEDSAMRVVPLDQIDHANGVADLAVGQNKDLNEKFISVIVKIIFFIDTCYEVPSKLKSCWLYFL